MKRYFFMVLACLLISMSIPFTASASSTASIISEAQKYKGVKYVHGGTSSAGFDCSGFTQRAFSDAGLSIPRTTGQQFNSGTAVDKANLQAGDLVFFNTSGKGVSHAGIYIGSNNFIHSSSSKGVMISSINDPYYWGSKYIGARRIIGQPAVVAEPKVEVTETEEVEEVETVVAKPIVETKVENKPVAKPQVVAKPKEVAKPKVEPETTVAEEPATEEEVEITKSEDIVSQIEYYHLHPTSLNFDLFSYLANLEVIVLPNLNVKSS